MRLWRHCEGTPGLVWRGPRPVTLLGKAPCGRWPELLGRAAVVRPAGSRPGERGVGRQATGSSPAGLNPFAHWGKGMRRLAKWGRSEGKMPRAKEGRARWRPVLIVGGEDLARLRNGRGGRQGGLL